MDSWQPIKKLANAKSTHYSSAGENRGGNYLRKAAKKKKIRSRKLKASPFQKIMAQLFDRAKKAHMPVD
ncbi:hypothetical protein TNCV_5098721 [Trichonephila clavipes]|uniref:Uncharacterized protein n=1 Tax=Trichonephila clavipes TaxID=2585209 RepID=A0A8X6RXI9_TRICX|nr:hypothetical protein TNCV_5098721 [Trichonephila clavipes]